MLDYCTVDDIKSLTNFAGRFDGLLMSTIKSVTERCNDYIRRTLDYEVGKVEVFNIPRLNYGQKYVIWLEKRKITAIDLALAPTRDFSDTLATVMEAASYAVDMEKGKITLYGYIPRALDGLRITYTGGYEPLADPNDHAMDCPASLRQAAAEQVAFDADRRTNAFGGTNEAQDKNKAAPRIGQYGLLTQTIGAFSSYRRPLG